MNLLASRPSILMPIFAMMVIVTVSNYLVTFPINDWLTWGAFTYPISFLVTELTNRFYGAQIARKVVYVGFLLAIVMSVWVAPLQIALASVTAFLFSQLLDITVFNSFRRSTWWYAPFFSSIFASLVDTIIFWGIAFWGEPVPIFTWALGDFSIKFAMDLIMLTPFRLAIRNKARLVLD